MSTPEILKVQDWVQITKPGPNYAKRGKILWIEERKTDKVMENHVELEEGGMTTVLDKWLEKYNG